MSDRLSRKRLFYRRRREPEPKKAEAAAATGRSRPLSGYICGHAVTVDINYKTAGAAEASSYRYHRFQTPLIARFPLPSSFFNQQISKPLTANRPPEQHIVFNANSSLSLSALIAIKRVLAVNCGGVSRVGSGKIRDSLIAVRCRFVGLVG